MEPVQNKTGLNAIRLLYIISLCILPLIVLVIYGAAVRDTSFFSNLFKAVTKIQPKLILNSFLVIIAFAVLFFCGFRIYLCIRKILKYPAFVQGMQVDNTKINHIETVLASFVLSSLAALLFLMTIGVAGLYYTPVLWMTALVIIFFPIGLKDFLNNTRHFFSSIRFRIKSDITSLLVVLALVYLGIPMLLVQLTNPFPPSMDSMEVYLAPITRVLTFHQYIPADGMPSALYNAYRAVPLHTAFYAFIGSLTGLTSYEAQAGSFIFILLITIVSVYYFTHTLGSRFAAGISVWLLAASCNFAHITDGRSGVYCMLYFFPGFAFYIKMMIAEEKPARILYGVLAGIAFGNVMQVHPVAGAYVLLCLFLIFIFSKIWISFNAYREGVYTLIAMAAVSSLLLFQLKELFHVSEPYIFLILAGCVLLAVPLLLFLRSALKKEFPLRNRPLDKKRRWLPPLLLLIVIHLMNLFKWHTPWHNETPFVNVLKLSPLLFTLGIIALLRIAYIFYRRKKFHVSRYRLGIILLFSAAVLISFSSSMYIIPLFRMEGVHYMSFTMEIPGKGLDFFILPLFVGIASLLFAGIKNRIVRFSLVPVVMVLVTLPSAGILGSLVPLFRQTAQVSVWQVMGEQAHAAGNGYFSGWDGDSRLPVSKSNLVIMDHIRKLVAGGDIGINDTIVHIAKSSESWVALPFPVFTGVKEDLFLLERDPKNIYTAFGRLYDFPGNFDYVNPPEWLFIERNVFPENHADFSQLLEEKYRVSFRNDRASLYRLDTGKE